MRILAVLALCTAACLGAAPAWSTAVADNSADVSVAAPAYTKDMGPIVAIDGGHQNFHTLAGRFAPFGRLLSNDGFRVRPLTGAFTAEALADVSILVIANALNPVNVDRWTLPTPSAFTAEEIAAVRTFVENGGSLLLIADHMPWGGAVADLAGAFNVTFFNGFAFYVPEPEAPDYFALTDGTLGGDLIMLGRLPTTNVSRVATFTGTAFRAPEGARPLLTLSNDYLILTPQTAWVFPPETPRIPAGGLLQGAAIAHGKGRLAVFGEAAMFTAQVEETDPKIRTGFSAAGADQNKQFTLNVVHWLAGLLGP
jgi:hypothetical protein